MSILSSAEISRLTASVELINSTSSATVNSVLLKIFQVLLEEQEIIVNEEKFKIENLYPSSDQSLNAISATLQYIIQQAIFHVMKPAYFSQYLKELGFNEQCSSLISELWCSHAKSVINKLKKESCSSSKVVSIESSLQYILSSYRGGHTKVPVALLHFNTTEDCFSKPSISLEFTHQELLSFYKTLETIQNNLDQLV